MVKIHSAEYGLRPIPPYALALLTLVCVLTYTFEIVFGLAGTILMLPLPLLSHLYPPKTLVIYSVVPQILVAAIGLVRSPKKADAQWAGETCVVLIDNT